MLDHDLVFPDPSKPVKPGTKLSPKVLEMEGFPADFNPLKFIESKGHANLPSDQKILKEINCFGLLWDEEIINIIVENTNTFAERCLRIKI
jgi:hypothetical protein